MEAILFYLVTINQLTFKKINMDERIIYDGFERVWKLFEKNEVETQRLGEKSEQEFQRVWKLFEKNEAETQQLKYSFQEVKDLLKEVAEQSKETDRRMQETDRQLQETDKQVKRVSQEIGRLGGRWGEFVESMVKPAVVRLFQQRGLDVHEIARNLTSNRNGIAAEIDLLVTNDKHCVAVEVKSFLSIDDINEHRERLEKFKILFPRYIDSILYGAVAGAVIPDDVARYAYKQGFFVIGQKGENMEILNNSRFKPRVY